MNIAMLNDPLLNASLELFGLSCTDIDDYSLQAIDKKHGHWQLSVQLKAKYPPCPQCKTESPKILGYYTSVVKVNLIDNITMQICVKRRRYRCRCCHKTWTEENPFVFKGQQISYGTVIRILEELKNPEVTYKSLAKRFNVSPTTIQNLIDAHLDIPDQRELPEFLVIDEVYAFRDSESGYVCVLLDGDTGVPVDVLPSRRKEFLSRFFSRYSLEERQKVKYFCSDMYQTYQDIARFKLPCAIRAIDRFHIFQDFERRIHRVRSRLLQGHHRTSDEYYLLKHQNHLLDIRPDATNRKTGIPLLDQNAPKNYSKHFRRKMNSRELLEKLLAVSPDLEEVYLLKNELNDFFRKNSGLNVKDRTRRENLDRLIEEFASSPVGEMNEFAALLIRWENEILNSFIPFRR